LQLWLQLLALHQLAARLTAGSIASLSSILTPRQQQDNNNNTVQLRFQHPGSIEPVVGSNLHMGISSLEHDAQVLSANH